MRTRHGAVLAIGLATLFVATVVVASPPGVAAQAPADETPTPTATATPLRGRWGGFNDRGLPVTFEVSPDGAQASAFAVTAVFSAPLCNAFSRTQEISDFGPAPIIDNHFSYSNNASGFSFQGWFTATGLATGTYALNNYQVSFGMDLPPVLLRLFAD